MNMRGIRFDALSAVQKAAQHAKDALGARWIERRESLTNLPRAARIEKLSPTQSGPVAQLGARFHGMEEVIGSIPIRSTN